MALFLSIDFGLPGAVDTQGARPYTGPNPLWNNSSIFIDGGPSQTQTKVGTPTSVKVRVSSAGEARNFVTVDAYVMAPFAGPLTPAAAVRTLQGFAGQITPGSGAPNPLDPHVVTCLIQDPVLGGVPWTPTQADMDRTTNGHFCLIANAHAEEPVDGATVPGATPFDVVNDPHQGQRNISVLQDKSLKAFTFQVFGPADGEKFALDIQQFGAKEFGASERWLLTSLANVKAVPRGGQRLFLTGRKGVEDIPLTQSRKGLRGQLDLGQAGTHDLAGLARVGGQVKAALAERPGALRDWGDGRLVLQAGPKGLTATVAVERDDAPGTLLGFDAVVRDAAGRSLGGLRMLTLQK
ncbi:hypothetical protein [Promicromonospora sp. NFX87]|uniref:hypothetical protein n=1 Tax=Promicromonospora sp. NFX87 TaxID=3402691 RepID=UPI003AFA9C22